jgi:predicted nucleic-acid-binding protein
MPALDTNVLVRIITGDEVEQQARAQSLTRSIAASNETLFIPLTVTLELEWVLRACYGIAKDEILATLSRLLETRELEFQDEPSVERALYLYRSGSADFAECLHTGASITQGRAPLLTFDRSAARIEGARLLT